MTSGSHHGAMHSFRESLERRVAEWLASDEARAFPCAALYAYLPPLFVMLTGMALDARVPARDRAAVMSALKYIVAPFDLIPEGVVGTSGFRDDLVLAAMVVDHLACRGLEGALRDHWQQEGEPVAVARGILDACQQMLDEATCERLRSWLPERER